MKEVKTNKSFGGISNNNGFYLNTPPEMRVFLLLEVYKRAGITQVEGQKRKGKISIASRKGVPLEDTHGRSL